MVRVELSPKALRLVWTALAGCVEDSEDAVEVDEDHSPVSRTELELMRTVMEALDLWVAEGTSTLVPGVVRVGEVT